MKVVDFFRNIIIFIIILTAGCYILVRSRNQKIKRKTGKWGRKFNNKYKAQNIQPKQTEEIKPKRSLRQKIKNFFNKLFDDKDI